MNAHTPIQASPLARAEALHNAAGNFLAALARSGGKWTVNVMLAECKAMRAAMELWPDDPIEDHLHTREDELGIRDRDPFDVFDPGMVHPDDPCQSKGYVSLGFVS